MKSSLYIYFLLFCFLSFTPKEAFSQGKKIVVCIDPGHGGKDPGKQGSKSLKDEKELNLEIAKKLGYYLTNNMTGVSVIYTRTTDKSVSLEERADLANQKKADYFISIHCNSNPNSAVRGTRTHIHHHDFKASKALALRVEKEFQTRAGRNSRGIMSARDRGYNLFVVQYTNMPAVLCEVGFISNKAEELYLNSARGQDIIASAIFRSFRDFYVKKYPEGDRRKVYKVQLMASKTKMTFKNQKLKDLELKIVEHQAKGSYKYKYMVGREYDMIGAKKLLKEAKSAGFTDAFIVNMTNAESRKFRVIE
jgi:N-acetylmuramoyl-L-alanine amidase